MSEIKKIVSEMRDEDIDALKNPQDDALLNLIVSDASLEQIQKELAK